MALLDLDNLSPGRMGLLSLGLGMMGHRTPNEALQGGPVGLLNGIQLGQANQLHKRRAQLEEQALQQKQSRTFKSTTMKLKPFDLTKAQAGHPWGTRDGRKGKKIFDTEIDRWNRLIAILENGDIPWCGIDGKYFKGEMEAEYDLFLYEEEKILWVVIYRDSLLGFLETRCLDEIGRLENESMRKADGTYIYTVEVRY